MSRLCLSPGEEKCGTHVFGHVLQSDERGDNRRAVAVASIWMNRLAGRPLIRDERRELEQFWISAEPVDEYGLKLSNALPERCFNRPIERQVQVVSGTRARGRGSGDRTEAGCIQLCLAQG